MNNFYNTNISMSEYDKWAKTYYNDIKSMSEEQKKNAFLRYQYRQKYGKSALGAFDKTNSFDEKVALYNGQNTNSTQIAAASTQTTQPTQSSVVNNNTTIPPNNATNIKPAVENNFQQSLGKINGSASVLNPNYDKTLNNKLGISYNKEVQEYQEITQQLGAVGLPNVFILENADKPEVLKRYTKLYRRKQELEKYIQDAMAINQAIADRKISVYQPKAVSVNPDDDVYIGDDGNFIFTPHTPNIYTVNKVNGRVDPKSLLQSLEQKHAEDVAEALRVSAFATTEPIPYNVSSSAASKNLDYESKIKNAKHKKFKDLTPKEREKYVKQYSDYNTTAQVLSEKEANQYKKQSESKWEAYYNQNIEEKQEKLQYIKSIAQQTGWYKKTRDKKLVDSAIYDGTQDPKQAKDWMTNEDYDKVLYAYTEAYEAALNHGLSEAEAEEAGKKRIAEEVEAAAYRDMPWYEAWGNATVQAIDSTITTAASTIGMIGSALNPFNWGDGYSYRVMHNPLSEWASEKMEKGLFTSDEDWEKYGINTFANPDDVTDYSISNFFAHTLSEAWGQSGFTWGSALGGRALGLATKYLFKGVSTAFKVPNKIQQMTDLASKIEGLEEAEKRFAIIQNRINKADNLVNITIPGIIGTNEGIIEGLQTEKNVLRNGYSELTDNMLGYLQQQQFDIIGLQKQAKAAVGNDPEKLAQYYLNIIAAGVNGGDDPTYYNMFKDVKAQIEDAAATAGTQNLMMNSVINGLFHTMTAEMWTMKRTQEALRNARNAIARRIDKVSPKLGKFISTKERFVATEVEGTGKATVKPRTLWYQPFTRFINGTLGVAIPEGAEEYFQSVTDAAAEGGAMANIHQFMKERYNGSTPMIGETFGIEWAAAREAATNAMVDPESWKQAFYGALGSLMPSPFTGLRGKYMSYKTDKDGNLIRGKDGKYETTIKFWNRKYATDKDGNTIKNDDGTAKKESILKTIARAIPFQSNAVMHYKSVQQRAWDRISQAKAIEDWINEDEKRLEMFKSIQGVLSAGEIIQIAEDYSAGMERRDALFRGLVHSALMISQLKGTAYYNSTMQLLKNMTDIDNLTEEQQEALVQSIADPSMSREDKLKLAKDRAVYVSKMLDQIDDIKESLEKQLGVLTPDQAAGLIYGKLSNENFKQRHKQLEDRISQIAKSEEFQNSRHDGVSTQEQIDDLVKYGSKSIVDAKVAQQGRELEKKQEKLKSLREELKQENSKKKADRKDTSKIKEDIRKTEDEISNINKRVNTLKNRKSANSDEIVLNEQEIMNLSARQRALILNSDLTNYSEEQARIIENVKAQGRLLDPEFDDIVKDSAVLLDNISRSMVEYALALKNPTIVSELGTREARIAQARYRQLRYESIARIKNYDDWVAAVEEAEDSNDVDYRTLQRVLRDMSPEFYERYSEGRDDQLTMMRLIVNDPKLRSIDDRQQELLFSALQLLRSKGVSLTDRDAVIDALQGVNKETGKFLIQEFIDEIDQETKDENERMSFDSVEEIMSIYNNVMDAYQEEIERRIKEAEASKEVAKPITAKESEEVVQESKSKKQKQRENRKKRKENQKKKEEEKKKKNEPTSEDEFSMLSQAQTFIYNKINSNGKVSDEQRQVLFDIFRGMQFEYESEADFLNALRKQANSLISNNDENTNEAKNGEVLLGILNDYDNYKKTQESIKAANTKQETKKTLSQKVGEKLQKYLRSAAIDRQLDIKDSQVNINNKRWFNTKDNLQELSRLANSSTMVGLSMKEYISSGNASESLVRYWEDNEVEKYLQDHAATIQGKTVYYYSPSAITERREEHIQELDAPLVAVVEDKNGKVVLETKDGPKNFQPIAIMPSSFNSTLSSTRNTKVQARNAYGSGRSFYIRQNIKETDELIQDEDNTPITSDIKKVSQTRTVIALGEGYTPSSDRSINEILQQHPEYKGKTKYELMQTQAYKAARNKFISEYIREARTGKETEEELKKQRARSFRRIEGSNENEGLHDFTAIDEARSKYTGRTLLEVVEDVLNNPEAYVQFYGGEVGQEFNSRATFIGKRLNAFFKTVNANELASMDEESRIKKLEELTEQFTKAFVNANGVYFSPTDYSFILGVEVTENGPQVNIFLKTNATNEHKQIATVTDQPFTPQEVAKTIANFFYNGGSLIKDVNWQIDDKILSPFMGDIEASAEAVKAAHTYLSTVYDDGLLGGNSNKVETNVTVIQLSAPQQTNNAPIIDTTRTEITNTDNAESNTTKGDAVVTNNGLVDADTGVSLEGKNIQQQLLQQQAAQREAQKAFNILKEESKQWQLTEDEKFYTREGKDPHARVTSILAADRLSERDKDGNPKRYDENNPWALPSEHVGNAVDTFLRNLFDGEYDGKSTQELQELFAQLSIAQEFEWKQLYDKAINFRDNLIRQGYHFESRGFTVNGVLPVYQDGKQIGTIPVAGTLDLIAYNAEGDIVIFDFKTHHSPGIDQHKNRWGQQVSIYKMLAQQFLESKGIQANFARNGLKIFHVFSDYNYAKQGSYAATENGTLLYRANESSPYTEYKGTRFKDAGEVLVAEKSVSIQFNDLLEEEKALVKRDDNESPTPPQSPEGPEGPTNTREGGEDKQKESKEKITKVRRRKRTIGGLGEIEDTHENAYDAATDALRGYAALEFDAEMGNTDAQRKLELAKKFGAKDGKFNFDQLSIQSQEQMLECE